MLGPLLFYFLFIFIFFSPPRPSPSLLSWRPSCWGTGWPSHPLWRWNPAGTHTPHLVRCSVADPDPGPVPFWPGIRNRFFPDIFQSLVTNFWVKISHLYLKDCQFFPSGQILWPKHFVKFVATKKGSTTNFFCTPLFCCCFGARYPGSGMGKNQDPG